MFCDDLENYFYICIWYIRAYFVPPQRICCGAGCIGIYISRCLKLFALQPMVSIGMYKPMKNTEKLKLNLLLKYIIYDKS